jgi:hypothetical protein
MTDSNLQTQALDILNAITFTTFRSRPNDKTMQTKLLERLSAADAAIILERLPERIRAAMIDSSKPRLRQRAAEIEYPIEATVEMAFT